MNRRHNPFIDWSLPQGCTEKMLEDAWGDEEEEKREDEEVINLDELLDKKGE